jgi:hypothetical protein
MPRIFVVEPQPSRQGIPCSAAQQKSPFRQTSVYRATRSTAKRTGSCVSRLKNSPPFIFHSSFAATQRTADANRSAGCEMMTILARYLIARRRLCFPICFRGNLLSHETLPFVQRIDPATISKATATRNSKLE